MGDQYRLNHCFKQICISGYHDRYFHENAQRAHFRGARRERLSWYYTDPTYTAKNRCPKTVSGVYIVCVCVCMCYIVINLLLAIYILIC